MQKKVNLMLVGMLVFSGLGGVLSFLPQEGEGAGLADSPWPMWWGGPKHTGQSLYDTSQVDGTKKWTFQTGDSVHCSPVVGKDGTIYFGSDDGNLYAVNPDGTEKWNYNTDGRVRSSPAVGSNNIYISSRSGNLYAFGGVGGKISDSDEDVNSFLASYW